MHGFLLVALVLSCLPTVACATEDPIPITRGKKASASSEETSECSAANAVDGDLSTRWSSLHHDPQWLMVDLGKSYDIYSVRLHWEKAFGREYEIQVSDDAKEWTRIYYTDSGRGGFEELKKLKGRGRYIRYYGTARGSVFGHSLVEFVVFGK
jgi:hypothetical protein